jgi:putative flippase GtrA
MKKLKQLFQNQAIRYIFFGGCTTLVNLVSYYLLREVAGMTNITLANFIAISLSILFAYVVNKLFVFQHRTSSFAELVREAVSFIGMRVSTLVIEIAGVLVLANWCGLNDMLAKFLIQFVVLVLNYIFSKFVIFKKKKE